MVTGFSNFMNGSTFTADALLEDITAELELSEAVSLLLPQPEKTEVSIAVVTTSTPSLL
jgi:hypothetical protein